MAAIFASSAFVPLADVLQARRLVTASLGVGWLVVILILTACSDPHDTRQVDPAAEARVPDESDSHSTEDPSGIEPDAAGEQPHPAPQGDTDTSADATSSSDVAPAADGTPPPVSVDANQGSSGMQGLGSSVSFFPEDCDQILHLRAHGEQTRDDQTPYLAPEGEHIETFWFVPNWETKMQLTYVMPIVDNVWVMRELRVYMHEQGSQPDGSHAASSGAQPAGASLLTSWDPGDKDLRLPPDVGLSVVHGPSARLALEISYLSTPGVPKRLDTSGIRACLTKKLRPKEAAFHWLGTQRLGNWLGAANQLASVSGRCTVKQSTHILGYTPRMRRQGRHIKATLTSQGGAATTLFDQPFEYERQDFAWLPQEVPVDAGQVISTECSHARDKVYFFGAGNQDEVCYALVLAWPAGSLTNGSAGLMPGLNTCWDGP